MNIYWESQEGGNCRIHALNAFFQTKYITPDIFNIFIEKYDDYIQKRYNCYISSRDYDLVNSDQNNVVSFILNANDVYTRYFALNALFSKNHNEITELLTFLNYDFIFSFDEGHIYGYRKYNGEWYKVDSISGVNQINIISTITSTQNVGYIFPVNSYKEYMRNIIIVRDILPDYSTEYITDYIMDLNAHNELLGPLEIPVNICISILEFQYCKRAKKASVMHLNTIKNLILLYIKFICIFSQDYNCPARYNLFPHIVHNLLTLSKVL